MLAKNFVRHVTHDLFNLVTDCDAPGPGSRYVLSFRGPPSPRRTSRPPPADPRATHEAYPHLPDESLRAVQSPGSTGKVGMDVLNERGQALTHSHFAVI